MCARSSRSSCARRNSLPSAVVWHSRTFSFAVASASTVARPLPMRSISVGAPLWIATTGLPAKTNLARGREKRTKVRPVKTAVKASPQMISLAATT